MSDYSKIAKQYEEYGKGAITDWKLGYLYVAKLLEPLEGKKILDYGSGNGKFSEYLNKFGAQVVGVDISASQLAVANQNSDKNIVYLLDDGSTMETKYQNYFDAGILIFVLCEIFSLEKITSILRRIHGLLRKDSELVILNPNWDKSNGKNFLSHQNKHAPNLKPGSKVVTILKGNPPILMQDFYWSRENYLNALTDAGFGDFEIHEPLAPNNSGVWIDETKYPPFLIIRARRLNG